MNSIVLPRISTEQEFILLNGGVPALRKHNIFRSKLQENLYNNIQNILTKNVSWLVVHGIPGCGKSQLVSDVLWAKPELSMANFKHIFWITDRNAESSRLPQVMLDAVVLISKYKSTNDIFNLLNLGVIGRHFRANLEKFSFDSKILIILDGVMLEDTIRFFEEFKTKNCYFLATSTNKEIFSVLENVDFINIGSDDLSTKELSQLAQNYNLNEDVLDVSKLNEISHLTGNNLALLEKLFSLASENPKIIPSLIHRLENRPLHELSCKTAYQYSNLEVPISHCFAMIEENIISSFDYLTIFKPFEWINLELILTVWPMDLSGSESELIVHGYLYQDLDKLIKNSLIDSQEGNYKKSFLNNFFRIPPIIHFFLLHSRPNSYVKFLQSLRNFHAKIENDVANIKAQQYYKENIHYLEMTRNKVENLLEKSQNKYKVFKRKVCTLFRTSFSGI